MKRIAVLALAGSTVHAAKIPANSGSFAVSTSVPSGFAGIRCAAKDIKGFGGALLFALLFGETVKIRPFLELSPGLIIPWSWVRIPPPGMLANLIDTLPTAA